MSSSLNIEYSLLFEIPKADALEVLLFSSLAFSTALFHLAQLELTLFNLPVRLHGFLLHHLELNVCY